MRRLVREGFTIPLGRVSSLALLRIIFAICVTFHPLGAAGQVRCDAAAASLVSVEGEVTIRSQRNSPIETIAAGTDTRLCPGEFVLVGPRSRATIRLEGTGQVIRLDQGTTLRVLAPRRPGRPLIDLPSGIIELFSPGNRPLDVETPYVTAGVFGTEFFVLVDTMRRFAEVGVITGQVQVENPQGRL